MLAWKNIGTLTIVDDWAFSLPATSNIFRVTHEVESLSFGSIRAVIGQEVEGIVLDRRLLSYRLGNVEGQLFVMPEGVNERKIAVRRLDELAVNWSIKIEELINLAVNLPLPISDIDGLQAFLDEKAIASEVETALLGKASTVHGHQISDVTGLEAELTEKAIASEVQSVLEQKAATVHNHDIFSIDGLQSALEQKADASEVETALLGKAPTVHGHVTDDITGLTQLIEFLQPRSNTITSPDIPIDPFPGLVWHEINANNLVESWVFLNNRWLSLTKYSVSLAAPQNGIGASASYLVPIDFRYDYLFADVMLNCDYNTSTMNSSNNWQLILLVQSTGDVIFNSGAILEDNISKIFEINGLYSFVPGERIQITFQKNGTAPNTRMGANFTYHLVRK